MTDTAAESELQPIEVNDAHSLELLRAIDFGLQVARFMDGPLYRRMKDDIDAELNDLAEEIINLDPDDEDERKKIRKVRHRIGALSLWQNLFQSYVDQGEAAEVQFQEEESRST